MFRTLIQLVVQSLQKQAVFSPTFSECNSRQQLEGAVTVTAAGTAVAPVSAVLKHKTKTLLEMHSI
jgi:hypothetical protein